LRFLLDSHSLLWFLVGAQNLSSKAREVIEDPDHDIVVSIASLWEIGIKHSLGKLTIQGSFEETFPRQLEINSIDLLEIGMEHVRQVVSLPYHHRDPFDRILVAQALVEKIPIVSRDPALDAYGILRIWQ
jgi:PIN domain nuclease of toxin-antitoxin system